VTLLKFLRRRDRGISALEFALTLPVLTFIMLGVADYGAALQQSIRLEAAARAGAQVAFTHTGDTRFNTADMNFTAGSNARLVRDAVFAKLSGWSAAPSCTNGAGNGVCVTYVAWCQCPQNGNAVGTNYAFDCSADSPPCEDHQRFASITATRNYSPLSIFPLRTLRGNVEIRVR
jgi:Flp pilus assembly protein TadG